MINPLISQGADLVWHNVKRAIGVLCVLAVIAILGLGVKRIFWPRATESYAQQVQAGGVNYNIEIYNPEDNLFIGIKAFGLKFGISKPTVKKIADITKELKPIQPVTK